MARGAAPQVCVERGDSIDVFLRRKRLCARNHNMEMRNTNLLTTKGHWANGSACIIIGVGLGPIGRRSACMDASLFGLEHIHTWVCIGMGVMVISGFNGL
jgi:hypothetical protein